MQTEFIMKTNTTKKKAVSQKETTDVSSSESSKIYSNIKATLEKRERERKSNLVEREVWSRRLAF